MYPAITLSFYEPVSPPSAPEPSGLTGLRREFEAKSRRLEETILNLDNLLSPADWMDAGDGFPGFGAWRWNYPASRAQDRSHAPVAYLNEEEWRQHVALARDLVTRNHLALGFRDHVSNFIGPVSISFVLRGQTPGASASGPVDADGDGEPDVHPLVKQATQAWEEWRELAEWGEGKQDREKECRNRLITEGEATLRFFVGDSNSYGLPYARHIEPELIRTPPGHTTLDRYGWGIVSADEDDEREEGIWLCRPDNVSQGREIDCAHYVRVKGNVDRTVKRGLSDFFGVAEHLRKVLGLLDNMGHVARLQAAITWWEQYPTATEAQVRAMIQSGADYSRPKLAPGVPTRTTDVQNYEPGSIIRTESGRVVVPGPTSTPDGFLAIQSAILRAVGFRFACPSYFSGDSDASFASVLVTGSPFVRITEDRQGQVKGFACDVARRVLEFCERSGRLPRGTSQRVRPVATAKPVVIADEEKQARTFLALYEKNVADPIDFIRKRGGDPKIFAANIQAWQKKFPPAGGGGPGDEGKGDPTDPSATPPGSAGGDGTSPNEPEEDPLGAIVGEHIEEARVARKDGEKWQVGSNWYTKSGGKIRKISDPGKKKEPTKKDQKAQAKAVTAANKAKAQAAAEKLAKGGDGLTHDDVRALDDHFATLTQDRMKEVARALGAKLSGAKKELAARLVERAKQLVTAPGADSLATGHPARQQIADALAKSPGLTDEQRSRYGKAMARAVEHMPPGALDRLGSGLQGMTFHPDIKAIPAAMVDQLASEPGLTAEQQTEIRKKFEYVLKLPVGGVYMKGFRHVHVDGDNVGGSRGRYSAGYSDAHGIYAHELTHAIDGPKGEISASPEWQRAFDAELKVPAGQTPPLTNYAGTKPSEGLAEFGRLVYATDVPHGRIATEFPLATAVFRARGLWPTSERTAPGTGIREVFGQRVEVDPSGSHGDVLIKTPARESVEPEADPAVVAFALATLRADGEDEAAAELLAEVYADDQGEPARESVLVEHGAPPFPGAVLTGDPPRWHHPVTGDEHPADTDHPHDEQAAGSADHDHAAPEDKGRFAKIRAALVDRLSKTAGGRAVVKMGTGGLWLFHKVEHKLLFAAKKTQEVAVAAAKERGLPEDKIPALKRALYIADFLGGYATGGAALAVAGPVAGKVAAIMPSASVAYLAYSTAKNPAATWRAARKVIADTFAKGPPVAHESVSPALAASLADRLKGARDPDWYLALFHAAMGQTDGDAARALELADAGIAAQPTGPSDE